MQQWGEQISEAEDTLAKKQEEVQAARAEVKEQKDALAKCSKALQEKNVRKDKIGKERGAHGLNTQEKEHEATKAKEEVRSAKHRVEGMLAEHEWIADDRKFFGQPNTHYDFKATDPKEAGQRIQKLEATKDKLSKNVNMRAMNMLGKAEEQCGDLVKKKKIVEGDKKKITLVIKELDEKKKQALRTAWDQVNKDFGSIFSNLLPGTTAKLEPPAGQDVLDGLEVKVGPRELFPVTSPPSPGGLWRQVEGFPERAVWRAALPSGALPHPRPAPLQAGAPLHPGRG